MTTTPTMHHTISNETIELVCQRTGATVLQVRRTLLGMASPGPGAAKIIHALVAAGVDREFLERISKARLPEAAQ